MGHSHYIKKCAKCGTVIAQCRCMSLDRKVDFGFCEKCDPNTAALSALGTPQQAGTPTPRSEGENGLREAITDIEARISAILNDYDTDVEDLTHHDREQYNFLHTISEKLHRALPVKAGEPEMSWDCMYCKKRLHKFNSPDHDSFCCGNHDCQSFGKAQWVVAVDRGGPEGDRTVEATIRANPDGSKTVTNIREVKAGEGKLPECCVNHAFFNPMDGLHYGPHELNGQLISCAQWACEQVEIHPVGTRARLSAHQKEA